MLLRTLFVDLFPSSKSNMPFPPRILRAPLDHLPLPLHLFFLPQYPRLPSFLWLPPPLLPMLPPLIQHIHILQLIHHPRNITSPLFPPSHRKYQINLLILRPWIIFQYSRSESSFYSSPANHLSLHVVLRIELTYRPPTSPYTLIQPIEESIQPSSSRDFTSFCIAKPLYSTYRNRGIKCACSKWDPLSNIRE